MSVLDKLRIALTAVPAVSLKHAFWYLLLAGLAWVLLHWLLSRLLARPLA